MHDKKREVRRYVVRTWLFSLRDPRRNAAHLNRVVGYCTDKLLSSTPAIQGKPKE